MVELYKAEYIWIDGTKPTAQLRSKTKIIPVGEKPPIWGFDGSSTNQAEGSDSDRVLKPVFTCPDPTRGGKHVLVLNEVMRTNVTTPHESNTRAACVEMAKKYGSFDTWFGIEQEYTLMDPKTNKPLGFPEDGYPGPQGPYYCGIGAELAYGREIVEAHLEACLEAGLKIAGINGEVMPGQWEFQVGPIGSPEAADHLWIARWLMYRIAEDFGVSMTLAAKPMKGDWNGTGAHTNFSTKQMRVDYDACVAAAEALKTRHDLHIANYGDGIEERLTGRHETASYKTFKYGVSDRGASVRIPWQVAKDKKGYIEDRRPCANMDPYVVTRLVLETVCGAASRGSSNGAKPAARVPARAAR
ncbi:MAG: glutamine synthetase [Dehalococcoidia bacterium]|nr:glutamine synthetase [Dehalococcoidia bacterium]